MKGYGVGTLIFDRRGSALALTLLALVLLSGVALALSALDLAGRQSTDVDAESTRAAYIARAAMERAAHEFLMPLQDWSTVANGTLLTAENFGDGNYDVSVLKSATNSVVLEVVTRQGDRTRRFEILVHRRTDAGGGTGITTGASFGPLLDRQLSPGHASLSELLAATLPNSRSTMTRSAA